MIKNNRKVRGLLLYSGGLDSILAAKLLLDQNVELKALSFVLPFFSPWKDPWDTKAGKMAKSIGLDVSFIRLDMDYMRMVEAPKNGWGKNINPCIDCKIYFLKYAASYMHENAYDFVATGEVLGQRPMSQQRNRLNQIEFETNLQGKLLRPLSAKHMTPTDVENEGLIDREKLLKIHGRSRDMQMALAKQYGIKDYATPAGGCLFTDENFAPKVKDLFTYCKNFYTTEDIYQCSLGRHFRINEKCKVIVSRNGDETEILYSKCFANCKIMTAFAGPVALLRGEYSEDDIITAATILLRYGKGNMAGNNLVSVIEGNCHHEKLIEKVADDDFINRLRIK